MIAKKYNAGNPMKSKQDELTESLLAMVSSMKLGATNEKTKGLIGSAKRTNEDQLALAKVAAGKLKSIMGHSTQPKMVGNGKGQAANPIKSRRLVTNFVAMPPHPTII